jgi:hypothetical protein
MDCDPGERVYTRTLGAICALILCVILTAGLWPFCAPKNDVEWVQGANGIRFGRHGTVVSAGDFRAVSPDGSCSLEIVLEPGRANGGGTILAFDSSPDPNFPFALRQLGASLAIQRARVDSHGKMVRPWLETDRVFEKSKSVVLTITGEKDKTVVYVDGMPARVSSGFGLVSGDLTGRLVLGDSTTSDSWQGQIAGLAVYDFALTPSEVETHSERWSQGQRPGIYPEKSPVALYLFDERGGSATHDRTGSGHELAIQARYFLLRPAFLSSPLGPFRSRWDGWMSWSYWSDVCLNVAGFVPLGFFFTIYFSRVLQIPRAKVMALLFGLTISLSIEIGQYFLPTRDSGMNDVITNTLGTAVGVALCQPILIRQFLKLPLLAGSSQWLLDSQLLRDRPAETGGSRKV